MFYHSAGVHLTEYAMVGIDSVLTPLPPKVDPFKLKSLSITPDQGSDGVSAIQFLRSPDGMGAMIDVIWDQSHAGTNCVKNTVKDKMLWSNVVLFGIAGALNFKSYGYWFKARKEAVGKYFRSVTCVTCPFLDT